MRMLDVLLKKRNGQALNQEEVNFFVEGYVQGDIPDYQASAFLMAIYFQGLNEAETAWLTQAMASSGDQVDLSAIAGIKVDKHSTGGVGDKTTLILGPLVAACGVPVAKMSGKGLGHTGGTIDKLESIPGFQTTLSQEAFIAQVQKVGLSVIGQSGNIAPADKMLYALRDVTATVDQMGLIAASIMSKKMAAGADAIVLDVKTGSGAFMKTLEDSVALAQEMVSIGETVGRKTVALITDMDRPLGFAIGNALEVREAVATLKGQGPEELQELCLELAAQMLYVAQRGDLKACREQVKDALDSGRALKKLEDMVRAQGGDPAALHDPEALASSKEKAQLTAWRKGFIGEMDTQGCGMASVLLGAGRSRKEDPIDYGAGILLHKSLGDEVEEGEPIATLYAAEATLLHQGLDKLKASITLVDEAPEVPPLIQARVSAAGVELWN